jgi:hypothetical protein
VGYHVEKREFFIINIIEIDTGTECDIREGKGCLCCQ